MIRRAWAGWRRHRVVHVNGNILLAGILSAAGTSVVLELTRSLVTHPLLVTGLTVVVDGVLDALAFALLHHLASRAGWKPERGSLARDTATIQLQRLVLVPLFFLLATGTQWLLLVAGLDRIATVWIAYLGALLVTRTLHTAHGLRTGLFRD